MHPRLKKLTHLSEAALAPSLALASSPQDTLHLEERSLLLRAVTAGGTVLELSGLKGWIPAFTVSRCEVKRERERQGLSTYAPRCTLVDAPEPHVERARVAFLLVSFTHPVNLLASRLASRAAPRRTALHCRATGVASI